MAIVNWALWQKLALIAGAGAAGTLARYGLAGTVQRWSGPGFPWGTLAVNLLGCLLFGLVLGVLEDRAHWAPAARAYLLIGFMGAFTTFSTFGFESSQMLIARQWLHLTANLALQNVVGLALVLAGAALGRLL